LSTKFGLNDPKIRCKLPSSFVDFIETYAKFKKELDEFERTFWKEWSYGIVNFEKKFKTSFHLFSILLKWIIIIIIMWVNNLIFNINLWKM